MDECLHAFTVLSLPTASLDVTFLYCCRGHYITQSEARLKSSSFDEHMNIWIFNTCWNCFKSYIFHENMSLLHSMFLLFVLFLHYIIGWGWCVVAFAEMSCTQQVIFRCNKVRYNVKHNACVLFCGHLSLTNIWKVQQLPSLPLLGFAFGSYVQLPSSTELYTGEVTR